MTSRSVNLSLQAEGGASGDDAVAQAAGAAPRIGPNSVLQTFRALGELELPEVVSEVARRAGLPQPLPPGMIPEAWFVQLTRALRQVLPPERSEAVLLRSGRYTGQYVTANRIPGPIRAALRLLPRRAAVPLLLKAFDRHAWTFAGAGRYAFQGPFPHLITLAGCPTARPEAQALREGPSCAYYRGAFEELLQLAAPGVQVHEVGCQAIGDSTCRFQLSLPSMSTT